MIGVISRRAFVESGELIDGVYESFLGDDVNGWFCAKNGAECTLYEEPKGWTWYAKEKNGDLSTSCSYFRTKEEALDDFNLNVDTED